MTHVDAKGPQPLVVVEDLRLTAGRGGDATSLVDSVSLQIHTGDAVGLVGESGCGKTLTVLAIAGLLPRGVTVAAESRVLFRDRPIDAWDPPPHGSEIGFVFQDPGGSINPVLRVGDQIAEVVRALKGTSRAEARARSLELLAEVGIADPAGKAVRYPGELSGGERQRVGVALALAGDPSLLVADEPTTGVDMIVQAQLLALIESLRRQRGMALVLVSHDLAVVAEVCERVEVLYAGEIVERGPVGEVLSAPRHPYTQGLVGCLPRRGGAGSISAIPGAVPVPGRWPDGCRFRPRCAHAFEPCGDRPGLMPLPEGRAARCWLIKEPGAA